MAKKLNKSLVGSLVLTLMVLIAAVGFVLVQNLPGSDPLVFANDAKTLKEAGKYEKAMEAYQRAYLKDDTKNPEYLVSAAQCAIEDGQIGNARKLLADALNNNPQYAPAHTTQIKLELELAKLFGGNLGWQRVLDTANAAAKYSEMKEKAITNYAKGVALLALSDTNPSYHEQGLEALRRASELDPTDVDTIKALAQQLVRSSKEKELKRNLDDARTDMQTANSLIDSAIARAREEGRDDDLAELQLSRAQFLLVDGKADEARNMLEKLCDSSALGAKPLLSLATLYTGTVSKDIKRDLSKSEAYLKKAIELEPGSGAAYLALGDVYKMQIGSTDDPDTKSAYQKKLHDLFEEGLSRIERSDHFRKYRDNQARVQLIQDLFLSEIQKAANADDDTDKQKHLDAAENRVAQMKEEVPANSPIALMLDAYFLNAKGEIHQATRQGEAALKAAGQRPYPLLLRLMADLYSRQGQWGRVQDMLEQAIAATPRNIDPNLYVHMGQVLLRQDRVTEALRYLKPEKPEALRQALLDNPLAIQLRMQAYAKLDQTDLMNDENKRLGKSDTLEGKIRQVYLMAFEKDYDKAERKAREIFDANPESIKALQLLVSVLQRADKKDEALQFVEGLVADHPDNRDYMRFKIALEPESDKRDKELLDFIGAIEDDQKRNLEFANYWRNHDDPEKEREYLNRLEKLAPDDPNIIERQFAWCLRQNKWDKANQYVDKIREKDLDGADGKIAAGRASIARGQALREQNDPDAEKVVRQGADLLRQGLDAYPSNSIAWTYLAQAYLILGDQDQAKEVLQTALENNPANGYAAKMRARIASEENDDDATRRYLAIAERAMPDDDWVLMMRQVLKEKDNPLEGIPGRVARRKEKPDDVDNLVMLARLYKDPKVGEYAKAEEVYRDALSKAPDNLGLLREVASFLASDDVNLPQEGEALLQERMQNTDDMPTKAILAASLAEFYASLDRYNTADRYYRMAVSFDPSPRILSFAADFYRKAKRYKQSIEMLDQLLKQPDLDRAIAQNAQSRKIAALLAMNELDQARAEIDAYLAAYPDDDQGMIYEGAWHRVAGDIKKAEQAFNEHLAKDPDSAVALWQRGQLYALQNKYQLAIKDLQRAKAVKPNAFNYQHRILLADAYVEVGRYDDAINELNDILTKNPKNDRIADALIHTYMRVQPPQYQAAEDLIYRCMRNDPRNYQWPMLLGQLGEVAHDLQKQVTGYAKAAELSQNQPDVVQKLFAAMRAAKDAQGIIDYATQKLTPSALGRAPTALSNLAWAYHQKGDAQRCIDSFKQSLAAAGDNFITYNQIIRDMFSILGPQRSLTEMKSAVDADPTNLLKRRALVHVYWMNGKIPEAIEVAQKIESEAVRDGDLLFAHLAKGMLYNAQENFHKAREEYEAALAINPNHPMLLNNLSYLLAEKLKLPKEALPYAKKAARLQPNNTDILDTYGWIQALNGQTGEAAGTLLRGLEIDNKQPDILLHLAKVDLMRGECNDAKRRLDYFKGYIDKKIAEGISPAEEKALRGYLPKINEAYKQVEQDCG